MKNYSKAKLEAKAKGEFYYFTGKPCRRGHIAKRWVNSGICLDCDKVRKEQAKGKYKDRIKNYGLLRTYNITLSELNSLIENQDGKCLICKTELDRGKHTHVDHCHSTGKIRAVLCSNCNAALGKFKHSPELLRKAAEYIEKFK